MFTILPAVHDASENLASVHELPTVALTFFDTIVPERFPLIGWDRTWITYVENGHVCSAPVSDLTGMEMVR